MANESFRLLETLIFLCRFLLFCVKKHKLIDNKILTTNYLRTFYVF